MKRLTVVALLLLLSVASWGLDQRFLEPVVPTSPSIKAQGGASTGNATGYEALFVNPATYADTVPSLTLFSLETTANIPLSSLSKILENRESWADTNYLSSTNPMTSLVNDLLTKTGIGAETSVGAGWVGRNLGVGLNIQGRTLAKGRTLLGATTTVDTTIQGVVGMGWPFDVGLGTLKVGGALRPMQKTYMQLAVSDMMNNMGDLSAYTLSSGFGLGWDLGLRWDYARFKTGFVIRDAGSTVFSFKDFNLSSWVSQVGFPAGGTSSGSTLYRIPTVIALGTNWTPDMGTFASLVQPSLSLDFQVPIKDEFTQPSFFTWTHLGAEAKFLQFLSVRTGLNQGYFTFGLGAKLFILDFNLAVYSDELGRYSGLNRRSALAMEWAFKL